MSENASVKRLNKAISDTGFCSRREADKLISEGRVMVNGSPAELGQKVSESDIVAVDGQRISEQQEPVYIAFNKPRGITCTTERHVRGNIIDFINHPRRIFPIGRLDKDSEGLIFLTSDGNIVNKILRSGNNHDKEYFVETDRLITPDFISKMSAGVPILNTVTKKCFVEKAGSHSFRIILTQGLNRQIRRMCDYLGYSVVTLRRLRIMNVNISGLKSGEWRELTDKEMEEILMRISGSSNTEEASYINTEEEE